MLYLEWITSKDLLYRAGKSAQCYMQPGWEGSFGRTGPCAVHLKLSHCYWYTPIQNKKFFFNVLLQKYVFLNVRITSAK